MNQIAKIGTIVIQVKLDNVVLSNGVKISGVFEVEFSKSSQSDWNNLCVDYILYKNKKVNWLVFDPFSKIIIEELVLQIALQELKK